MRKIIHLDMDCFFAAVEMRENPQWRGRPLAVGGAASKRGVISTCNYEARQFGVRSAMASALALRLCPQLILVGHSPALYREASDIMLDVCYRYTDKVQRVSMDEAYLDVTDSELPLGSATLLAQKIRAEIFAQTQLTVSAGIAPNKLLAKLASETNKPNGQYTISPDKVLDFMTPLPLGKIHGIGRVTADYLAREGLKSCADVLALSRFALVARFARLGDMLYTACRGIDERPVETIWERKSLSVEKTFSQDLTDPLAMQAALAQLMGELIEDLRAHPDKKVHGLQVKIKYHDFKQTTIERNSLPLNLEAAWSLYQLRWQRDPRPVRLIGVGVRFVTAPATPQLSFDALAETG